jgi:hypothetical protein
MDATIRLTAGQEGRKMRNLFSRIFKNISRIDIDEDAKSLNRELVDNVSTRTEITRALVPELTQNRYKSYTYDLASVLSEMTVVGREENNHA